MKFRSLAFLFVFGLLAGPVAADVVTDWNDIAANAVATGRPGPIGQMDLALVQAAVHDAIQAYEKRFEPYYAELTPGSPRGSKVAAAAAAAHGVLVGFYAGQPQVATLDATYATYLANNGLTGDPGIAVGDAVTALYLPLRRLDPAVPTQFTGSMDIGKWRPTESLLAGPPPTLSPMHAPWMASFDPFTLTGPARFRSPPPPDLTSVKYAADYNEVKAKGALVNSTRTPEQTDIANFWTDNFAVQWNRAVRGIIEKRVPKTGDRARLLALANLAGADAVITAWNNKLFYNFWRPVTAIRAGDLDGNAATEVDATWQSLVNNPPYPDHTSGANNITGAMTKMLELYFGRNDISFAVTSNALAAIKKTRTFSSFTGASQQVVNARVYLGIHFRTADVEARKTGRRVAEWVHEHYLLPVTQ